MDKVLIGIIIVVGLVVVMATLVIKTTNNLKECTEEPESMKQCFECCRDLRTIGINSYDDGYCYEKCELELKIKDFV